MSDSSSGPAEDRSLPGGVTQVRDNGDGTVTGSDGRLYALQDRTRQKVQTDEYGNSSPMFNYNEGGYQNEPIMETYRVMADVGEDPVYKTQREGREAAAKQATLLEEMRVKYQAEEAAQRKAFEEEQAKLAKEIEDQKAAFEAARVKRITDRKNSQLTSAKSELTQLERMSQSRKELVSEEDISQTANLTEEEEKKIYGKGKTLLEKILGTK